MLEHVSRGQKLTTDLVNGIIDKANGQMIPSDGNFVNTKNGTLFQKQENLDQQVSRNLKATFLQCEIRKCAKQTARHFTFDSSETKMYYFINLGKNYESAKENIRVYGNPIDYIITYSQSNTNLNGEIVNFELDFNSTMTNSMFKTKTGWYNTGVEFAYNNASQSEVLYGNLVECKADEDDVAPKFAFVISNLKSGFDNLLNQIVQGKSEFEVVDTKTILTLTHANEENMRNAIQIMIGNQQYFNGGSSTRIPLDSEISALALSSLEFVRDEKKNVIEVNPDTGEEEVVEKTFNYYQLFNFDKAAKEYSVDDISSDGLDSFVIRRIDDDYKSVIDYMDFNSLSNFVPDYLGDTNLPALRSESVERKYDEDSKKRYFQLANWDNSYTTNTITVDIPTDGSLVDFINDQSYIVTQEATNINGRILKYNKIKIQAPYIDTDYINTNISNITSDISSIKEDIEDLSSQLSSNQSGDYWEQGGDSSTNFGSTIGNDNGDTVIELNEHTLCGWWKTENLAVGASNSVDGGNCSVAGDSVVLSYGPAAGSLILDNGEVRIDTWRYNQPTLQIGSTTITETQLQQLLALLN